MGHPLRQFLISTEADQLIDGIPVHSDNSDDVPAPFGRADDDNGPRLEPPPHDRKRYVSTFISSRRWTPAAVGKPSFPCFKVYYLPRRFVLAESTPLAFEDDSSPMWRSTEFPKAYATNSGIGAFRHCPTLRHRPTDFGPRSLLDATAPKGSEDKGYNVRKQGISTQCPASAWMDSFDNIFRPYVPIYGGGQVDGKLTCDLVFTTVPVPMADPAPDAEPVAPSSMAMPTPFLAYEAGRLSRRCGDCACETYGAFVYGGAYAIRWSVDPMPVTESAAEAPLSLVEPTTPSPTELVIRPEDVAITPVEGRDHDNHDGTALRSSTITPLRPGVPSASDVAGITSPDGQQGGALDIPALPNIFHCYWEGVDFNRLDLDHVELVSYEDWMGNESFLFVAETYDDPG
ncbi:hypothetical protein THAOC_05526 [Thalassiosira oceanica]|uniref:Uncharacterized protein n=1 Tax=Thalassiosira oceanica TaxID=159749 RepID=K0TGV3_THAOC|nr:hypothetical protein THAOC_05526 [Thalassiosira oceanica]|eukprot:EJK72896.1 hypothetical protein THAOC_05526 [Thalassiosira oceanica]